MSNTSTIFTLIERVGVTFVVMEQGTVKDTTVMQVGNGLF